MIGVIELETASVILLKMLFLFIIFLIFDPCPSYPQKTKSCYSDLWENKPVQIVKFYTYFFNAAFNFKLFCP